MTAAGADDEALIAVVVVSWNGAHLLRACLDSLADQSLPAHPVIVVDNASQDGTESLLRDQYPDVEVIKSDTNQGFAGGANLGLARAMTPYVVLLNNDARAHRDLLKTLVAAFEREEPLKVGAVTANVLLDGTALINSTGNLVSRTGRGFDRDWRLPDDGSRAAGEVFGFCGAGVALRKEALEDVGLFDGDLFLYYEDTDLSWRLRARGWSIRYEPTAIVTHKHAATSAVGSPFFHYWNERNSLIVFTRHAPARLVIGMTVRRAVGLMWHTIRMPGSPITRARWRAARAHVHRLPTTLRERQQIWSRASTPRRVVGRELVRLPRNTKVAPPDA